MTSDPTPEQRLAISRARLADALRDPIWMVLLHRWLQTPSPKPTQGSQSTPPDRQPCAPTH